MDNYKIINCENCKQRLKIPSNTNLRVTCPKCGSMFKVDGSQHTKSTQKTFVEELRQMPSKKDQELQRSQEQAAAKYSKELSGILSAIRGACINNRDQKCAKGFIVREYDDEYCVYSFKYLSSLERDNSSKLTSPYNTDDSGTKYDASIISDRQWSRREGLAPISEKESDCTKFINDLHARLLNDGFRIEALSATPCYQEFDVLKIKAKGLFSTTRSFKHIKTDKLLGYVIEFCLAW